MQLSNADALSRCPCLDSDCRHCARQEAKEQLQREELDQGKCFSCQSAGTSKEADALSKRWSTKELRDAQMSDEDLGPVLQWKKKDETTRPPWQMVASHSEKTKAYWEA